MYNLHISWWQWWSDHSSDETTKSWNLNTSARVGGLRPVHSQFVYKCKRTTHIHTINDVLAYYSVVVAFCLLLSLMNQRCCRVCMCKCVSRRRRDAKFNGIWEANYLAAKMARHLRMSTGVCNGRVRYTNGFDIPIKSAKSFHRTSFWYLSRESNDSKSDTHMEYPYTAYSANSETATVFFPLLTVWAFVAMVAFAFEMIKSTA